MYRLTSFCLLLLVSCTAPNKIISYSAQTIPIYTVDPPPQKIILLNTYNVAAKKFRDNKEELFLRLIDSLMNRAAVKISDKGGAGTEVIMGTCLR